MPAAVIEMDAVGLLIIVAKDGIHVPIPVKV